MLRASRGFQETKLGLWCSPNAMNSYPPGTFVKNPARPDWGLGQVQSAIGDRVTVNFENAGKLLLNVDIVALEIVPDAAARED
jgi:hypothetical protein